jgi:ADP-heptose:LPS heptosyltransferase
VDKRPARVGSAFGPTLESQAQAQDSSMLAQALRPTVFLFCRLGDMVMLTPLLNLLHQRYRRPCQVIGTGSWTSAVYTGNPDVSEVWSFHRHVPFVFEGAWRAVRRALKNTDPGPIYVCEPHYRQLPRIRRMLKVSGVDPRRCEYLFEKPTSTRGNLVDLFVRFGTRTPPLLRAADYPAPASIGGPRLYVLDSERAERDSWLRAQGWYGRELILIQPGNHRTMGPRRARWRRMNTDDKWWPLERWAALSQRMHDYRKDALLVLRGSVEEIPMLEEIRAAAKLPEVAVVGNNLRQLFALCEVAHSMISVDSGPAHVAGALNVPLVVLYGAQAPMDWLPRSPSGTPVLGVGGPPQSARADQVSVDAVLAAWCTVIQKASRRRDA